MKALLLVYNCALRYRLPLIIATVSMIGLVGLQLIVPWSIRELLVALKEHRGNSATINLSILLLAVFVARLGFQFCNSYLSHVAGWGVVSDVRQRLYLHVQRLSLRFHEDQKTGALMSRVVNDSDMFERLISHAVPDTLVNVLRLAGVAIVLSIMNWKLMLLTLIPVPFIIWTMQLLAVKLRPAFRER